MNEPERDRTGPAARRAASVSGHLAARVRGGDRLARVPDRCCSTCSAGGSRLETGSTGWCCAPRWPSSSLYGLWRGRGSNSVNKYLLAGKTMPWYAMALSIMATQASAVTFISTTGQSYVDGMRFVQFYFGLPLAMVILSATAVPIFHRANVYTAYEYLEQRFDAQDAGAGERDLPDPARAGAGHHALRPGGCADRDPRLAGPGDHARHGRGGGPLHHAGRHQGGDLDRRPADADHDPGPGGGAGHGGPAAAGPTSRSSTPCTLAGAAGKLNAVTLNIDWNDRYNLWSGLIGGMFLALAYFGCDQSQVQRYLTGQVDRAEPPEPAVQRRWPRSRCSSSSCSSGRWCSCSTSTRSRRCCSRRSNWQRIQQPHAGEYEPVAERYDAAFESRKAAADQLIEARRSGDAGLLAARAGADTGRRRGNSTRRARARRRAGREGRRHQGLNDTNYIFLTFVTQHLPAGLVGLVLAVIFGATMSTISAEMNSLATVSMVDIYKRHFRQSRARPPLPERVARRDGVLGRVTRS